jgi:hypothetical protein
MSNWLIYGGVVCLEEVSLGCPFPRIRNCIRLGFGYWGRGLMKGRKQSILTLGGDVGIAIGRGWLTTCQPHVLKSS